MSAPGQKASGLRVCYFGTYSRGQGYPRNAVVMSALRRAGAEVVECHVPLFSTAEEKTRLARSLLSLPGLLPRLLACYVRLAARYFRLGSYDVMVVGYGGLADVVLARALTILRRRPLIYDSFFSVYDSVVHDRRLCRPNSLKARLLWWYDKLMCRLADRVLLDTNAHIDYFVREFRLPRSKFLRVWVGSDKEDFVTGADRSKPQDPVCDVLFWGTFIPLHGLETIVAAAHRLREQSHISITIVGRGQIEEEIRQLAKRLPSERLRFTPPVPYEKLVPRILRADVCLGIFGATEKAQRVVPCKVFECLCLGKPLITGDTPAVGELLNHGVNAHLVPCNDPDALAEAILRLAGDAGHRAKLAAGARDVYQQQCSQEAIGHRLAAKLQALADGRDEEEPGGQDEEELQPREKRVAA